MKQAEAVLIESFIFRRYANEEKTGIFRLCGVMQIMNKHIEYLYFRTEMKDDEGDARQWYNATKYCVYQIYLSASQFTFRTALDKFSKHQRATANQTYYQLDKDLSVVADQWSNTMRKTIIQQLLPINDIPICIIPFS